MNKAILLLETNLENKDVILLLRTTEKKYK